MTVTPRMLFHNRVQIALHTLEMRRAFLRRQSRFNRQGGQPHVSIVHTQ